MKSKYEKNSKYSSKKYEHQYDLDPLKGNKGGYKYRFVTASDTSDTSKIDSEDFYSGTRLERHDSVSGRVVARVKVGPKEREMLKAWAR